MYCNTVAQFVTVSGCPAVIRSVSVLNHRIRPLCTRNQQFLARSEKQTSSHSKPVGKIPKVPARYARFALATSEIFPQIGQLAIIVQSCPTLPFIIPYIREFVNRSTEFFSNLTNIKHLSVIFTKSHVHFLYKSTKFKKILFFLKKVYVCVHFLF
jgi:hypothetical protein